MFCPTVVNRWWNTRGDPVKWIPARFRLVSATSDTARPSPVTMLITPGGGPASRGSCMDQCAAKCWVGEGLHTTGLPMRAGAVARLPAMAVKLNGVIA
jgi:hypothetical protein